MTHTEVSYGSSVLAVNPPWNKADSVWKDLMQSISFYIVFRFQSVQIFACRYLFMAHIGDTSLVCCPRETYWQINKRRSMTSTKVCGVRVLSTDEVLLFLAFSTQMSPHINSASSWLLPMSLVVPEHMTILPGFAGSSSTRTPVIHCVV